MSKFNFKTADFLNIFSGEDGIGFIHQNENGENCLEINSDNLIYCIKTHLGPLFGDSFDANKTWIKLTTPKGELVFNIEEARFCINKMFIPFIDKEEKEKFGKITDEWYEDIIKLENGNYLWKLIEARENEGVWDSSKYEGENPLERYSKFFLESLGKPENYYNKILEIYKDLFPNVVKEFEDLKNSKADWFMIFKPLVDIATLGIFSELTENEKFMEFLTNFITKFSFLSTSFKEKRNKQNDSDENMIRLFEKKEEKNDKEYDDWKLELKEKISNHIDSILNKEMSFEDMEKSFVNCINMTKDIIRIKKEIINLRKDIDNLKK